MDEARMHSIAPKPLQSKGVTRLPRLNGKSAHLWYEPCAFMGSTRPPLTPIRLLNNLGQISTTATCIMHRFTHRICTQHTYLYTRTSTNWLDMAKRGAAQTVNSSTFFIRLKRHLMRPEASDKGSQNISVLHLDSRETSEQRSSFPNTWISNY